MRRREFAGLLGAAAAWPFTAHAQQPTPVLAYLSARSREAEVTMLAGFRKGLAETGFIENRNVAIEFRFADGQVDRLPALAAELTRQQLAVLVAVGGRASAVAAQAANPNVPIVFNSGVDPVQLGLVASFNRPGGTMTGVYAVQGDLVGKNLGLLRALLPKATKIAILAASSSLVRPELERDAHAAAASLGLEPRLFHIVAERELDAAYATLRQAPPEAMLLLTGPVLISNAQQVVDFVARLGIPAIYNRRDYAAVGGLISYGGNVAESYRFTGILAGRILKGDKPADLPIFQTNKLELVINLKTARTLGLAVPPTLLALADEVIE